MNKYRLTIEGRLKSLSVVMILAAAVLLVRMFDLQILHHDQYLTEAEAQQQFDQTTLAERGKILVHDSSSDPNSYYPLAFDVKKYSIWAIPQQIKDKAKVASELASVLSMTSESDIFNEINNNKLYIPPIKKGLTLDEANAVKAKNIVGVVAVPENSRYYPEDTLASQVLGFVNASGEGNYGFESYYNNELKGKDGSVQGQKDTLGRIVDLTASNDPQNGTNYVLTIDRSVQYYVEKALNQAIQTYQADGGTVIVMDVKTGGIIAMASSPDYNPNNFSDQATKDPSLFMNPAISYTYEPGSIMKPIMMSGALDQGVITPDSSGVFGSSTVVDGYTIHTATGVAFGQENMTQILENSDNVGMTWVSGLMGKDSVYKYANAFGLLDKTGVDLNGEVAGRVPPFKDWHDINRANISFGQGISVTPMEIVAAYAAIANGGKYIYPHIVDKMILADGTQKQVERQEGEQIIKPETAKEMTNMLVSVVTNGHSKKAGVPGFLVAGKTGTAQIATNGIYETSPTGTGIYNLSEAGFAPANDPQFAMLVKLTRPRTVKYAESSAAPVFGDIASYLLNFHYRITPTEPIK